MAKKSPGNLQLLLQICFCAVVIARLGSSLDELVGLTYVETAAQTEAFCLDGSLPVYRIQRGFGPGANNWLIQFEGGGWCNTLEACKDRAKTRRGSSHLMAPYAPFSGILSGNKSQNPVFYNWNRVKLMYCDGASFAGDVDEKVSGLYFRGTRIWRAMIHDLLEKGLNRSEQALLSGCSAGGLAVFLHCDDFRELMPSTTKVKCLSDAGFFLNAKDISGNYRIRTFYNQTVTLQEVGKNLPRTCTSFYSDPVMCFFPQYLYPYITTPMFVLNSAYDTWQIHNILVPSAADPDGTWSECKKTFSHCTEAQIEKMTEYRGLMLDALASVMMSRTSGMFIDSCIFHCQSEITNFWYAPPFTTIRNKTMAEMVSNWYFDRNPAKEIDLPYPCDKTCYVLEQNTTQVNNVQCY